MNNRIVACILAVFFAIVTLCLAKTVIGKKKWGAKRVLLCVAGLGSAAATGCCAIAARKF